MAQTKRRSPRKRGPAAPARTAPPTVQTPARLPRRHALARAGIARQRLSQRYALQKLDEIESYETAYRQVAASWGGTGPALRVLAEGDSWFDYPALAGNGVVARLKPRLRVPILNLAAAGDEVRAMSGLAQRRTLEHVLTTAPKAFDALLFSGGGNDVAGDPMCLWIKPYDAGQPPAWHVDTDRFAAVLAIVRAGYEDLIALRDRASPDTHLFFHQYDFAIPDGRGVLFIGPWLKPALDYRGVPDLGVGRAIIRAMLVRFAAMLDDLAARHPRVTVVKTQGILDAHPEWWHNELHPNPSGFNAMADRFHTVIRQTFPGRVA